MHHHQTSKNLLCGILCLLAMSVLGGCASQKYQASTSVFVNSESPMQDVQAALDNAKQNETLLLIVMGAQWCHDSRGLADTFANPKMASILEQFYEVIYIDVGYYKDLRPISNRFGQAHYFATPTVMIVDSVSEKLLNSEDLAMWGSADSLPIETYISYFTRYADKTEKTFAASPQGASAANLQLVKDFEQQQAARLQYAYGVLVPDMLREDLSGQTSEGFMKRWVEVRTYRTNLQRDIQSLYKQINELKKENLSLPVYEPFSWE